MSNGKVMIVHLVAGLIKKTQCNSIDCLKMSQCFPKPYEPFGRDMNVKVDLSNYAAKRETKNISHVDASNFALKSNIDKLKSLSNNLSNLKSKVDKLDIDKLVPLPVDLSRLSNIVKNEVVRKTE